MSIKAIALATAAIAATATTASATNYFAFGEKVDRSSVIELGTVRAESNGVVELYDFRNGEIGALLGSEMVNAGANGDVRVNVGIPPQSDVVALLRIGDDVVAERDYRLND